MTKLAHQPHCSSPLRQRGAALLAAMLTVALVATFAASAMWQQWRAIEVESAERSRIQSAWILVGALDWSRLILREDSLARNDSTDNLTEPWSIPLEEARLSTFLSAQNNVSQADDASAQTDNAFLSGRVTDMQSRMNLTNLVKNKAIDETALAQFERLFSYLGLQQSDVTLISSNMLKAQAANSGDAQNSAIPLMPQTISQLSWWGVSQTTIARIAPHVTILPMPTKVNVNTAGAEVIWASAVGLDMSDAQRIIQARSSNYYKTVAVAAKVLSKPELMTSTLFDVSSDYFEVRGRMRIDKTIVEERSLVLKQRGKVRTLWRERGGFIRNESADAMGKS